MHLNSFRNSRHSKTVGSRLPIQEYKILKNKNYTNFFYQENFFQNLQDTLIEHFLIQAQLLKNTNDHNSDHVAFTITLSGSELQQVMKAYDALELFLTTCLQHEIINKTKGNNKNEVFVLIAFLIKYLVGIWVCRPEAAHIIQTYANQNNINCLCEISENVGLQIYYFTSTAPHFKSLCTTRATIQDMVTTKCNSTTIKSLSDLDEGLKTKYIDQLEKIYLKPSYKDTLLIINHDAHLILFGFSASIKNFMAEFKNLKEELIIGQAKHDLSDYQVCHYSQLIRLIFYWNIRQYATKSAK